MYHTLSIDVKYDWVPFWTPLIDLSMTDPTLSIDFKYDWSQLEPHSVYLTLSMTGVNLDPTLSIDFKYDWSQLEPHSVY